MVTIFDIEHRLFSGIISTKLTKGTVAGEPDVSCRWRIGIFGQFVVRSFELLNDFHVIDFADGFPAASGKFIADECAAATHNKFLLFWALVILMRIGSFIYLI